MLLSVVVVAVVCCFFFVYVVSVSRRVHGGVCLCAVVAMFFFDIIFVIARTIREMHVPRQCRSWNRCLTKTKYVSKCAIVNCIEYL